MTEASFLAGYHQNLNTVQAFTETKSLYFLGEQLGNCFDSKTNSISQPSNKKRG
jgi:hypothetical protein